MGGTNNRILSNCLFRCFCWKGAATTTTSHHGLLLVLENRAVIHQQITATPQLFQHQAISRHGTFHAPLYPIPSISSTVLHPELNSEWPNTAIPRPGADPNSSSANPCPN